MQMFLRPWLATVVLGAAASASLAHAQATGDEVVAAPLSETGVLVAASDPTLPAQDEALRRIVDARLKEIELEKERQKKEAVAQGYEVGSDPKLNAKWDRGMVLESAHKDFKVQVGARVQNDWVWFNEPANLKAAAPTGVGPLQDGTFFRRLRLQAKGTAWEVTEFNLEFDLESMNQINMDHAWWGVKDLPVLGTVRVGQSKVPFGLESYRDSKWLTFLERSACFDAYDLEFSPGIFVSNTAFEEQLSWQAMFHRTPGLAAHYADGGSPGADFGAGGYGATARAAILPYYEENGRYLLHLGAACQYLDAKYDSAQGNVVGFRARPEIRDGNGFGIYGDNTRWIDTGLIQAADVKKFGGEVMANLGSLNLLSEYYLVGVDQARIRNAPAGNPHFYGGYVQASYFLTGEHQPYDRRFGLPDRPLPNSPFFRVRGEDGSVIQGPGLWEIAARCSYLCLLDNPALGVAGSSAVVAPGTLTEYTVGLNWWLNSSMKVQWNYVRVERFVLAAGGSGGVDEFGMRFHVDF